MEDVDDAAQYVAKAMESFAGASSEFSNEIEAYRTLRCARIFVDAVRQSNGSTE